MFIHWLYLNCLKVCRPVLMSINYTNILFFLIHILKNPTARVNAFSVGTNGRKVNVEFCY